MFHRLQRFASDPRQLFFGSLKGLSVPSARREWLPARSTSTFSELSLGRRDVVMGRRRRRGSFKINKPRGASPRRDYA